MTDAITVEGISKHFRVYHERNQTLKSAVMRRSRGTYEDFLALDDVSFAIPESSTFALVGDNGSGKSTLLKCMAQILVPDAGTITMNGKVAALLEVGSGFHPELSGRDNVYLNGSILGMSRRDIDRKFDEIVDFSGVEQFIDQPVKNYSSGMYVRLGFSVAINVEPEILLVDEVLAVGDTAFQAKCTEKFASLNREGRTVVLVSHSLPSVRAMADQAVWLSHGHVQSVGRASDVLEKYEESTRGGDGRAVLGGVVHTGSGEARVTRVEVVPPAGHDRLVVGEPATLRLHVSATTRVERPVVGFAVEALDGTYLAATNTRDAGAPVASLDGDDVIECVLPSIQLHPGDYIVTAAITDETTTHSIDHVRDVVRFTVDAGARHWSGGYLALPADWAAPVTTGPEVSS
ncbi:ABC transporter ATP-binding protein [Cellulomonas fimi]|uniref:ABC transporter related protein n=1 Tax=Cellulomonas fimi (strain ATCC 484 / DSM 20113 / JCM 1341 / CCUG 24087 / LMG 16345 / NBRC 15513 / NCIMB 8980 / NCTC 7547 / NRS-133) TaxID=590998 RepID=F4H536_CELFA|nr:ABC transporter ATP-binding protein [Cellulomonas fimi]AEE46642.1 ABC transporter related protein [Cellulomonas fimi ATCC 484]NNH08326.1 ABC transporter ATP-binding protein [Cellulomonas fimi]VEH33752.1 Teichoic acids export ATP-binding protein TagH [Cellulomonas fimi]